MFLSAFKDLILPPADLILIGLAGFIIGGRRPQAGRIIMACALFALYVLATPLFSNALLSIVCVRNAQAPDAQAIVVLSAGFRANAPEYGGLTADSLTLERLRYAVRLERESHLPILVSGGQIARGEPPLADIMGEVLESDFGITPRWKESQSSTTAENATYSARILRTAGVQRIYLVTHAWHMARARLAFRRAGFDVIPMGTGLPEFTRWDVNAIIPSARGFLNSFYACHEMIGYAWYYLTFPDMRAAAS
jgi:uncharacterized SAM-binding protein YcdF (DUF218 family)